MLEIARDFIGVFAPDSRRWPWAGRSPADKSHPKGPSQQGSCCSRRRRDPTDNLQEIYGFATSTMIRPRPRLIT